MKKEEMIQLLRGVGVHENSITAMTNAYDIGHERGQRDEREECAQLMFDIGSAKLATAIRERGEA